jgi:hypothetical protein
MLRSTPVGHNWLISLCSILLLALLAAGGCDRPQPIADDPTQQSGPGIEPKKTPAAEGQATGTELPAAVAQALQAAANAERSFPEPPADDDEGAAITEVVWEAFSLQGSRIGFSRTTYADVEENGEKLVRIRNRLRTRLEREGQAVEQEMTLTSWETPSGELRRFETRMSAGPQEMVAQGAVRGGKLFLEVGTLGKTQSHEIPWKQEWGGFFAGEQSLRRSPLQPGETRTLTALQPLVYAPGETTLTAGDYETVQLPTGEAKLLRIESASQVGGQQIAMTMWADEQGRVQKSLVAGLGQETVRTTKEDALRLPNKGGFDLVVDATVPLVVPLKNAAHTKHVVYRAHVTSGTIEGVFAHCLAQRVKPIDDQTAEVTVLAVRPDEPAELDVKVVPPTDEDRAANSLIQSDDAAVVAMAKQVAPDETDQWKLACALEKHVRETVRNKNYAQAFATAAEVARSLEGDCTEHAVLLAALCRARGIPARGAFGLVYYEKLQGFAYHMWTEAWIDDRWVPLDATRGLGGIGADHLKLGDDSLAGADGLAAMLPVIQVLGRLELTVVTAE